MDSDDIVIETYLEESFKFLEDNINISAVSANINFMSED
jgi:hypothetical protein